MNPELILAALNYTPQEAYDIASGKEKRCPDLEPIIATVPELAYYYAINIFKGRWPEAETVIATSPSWAFIYAINIIKGRWPEGESAIVTDPWYKEQYEKEFKVKL